MILQHLLSNFEIWFPPSALKQSKTLIISVSSLQKSTTLIASSWNNAMTPKMQATENNKNPLSFFRFSAQAILCLL